MEYVLIGILCILGFITLCWLSRILADSITCGVLDAIGRVNAQYAELMEEENDDGEAK